MIEAQKMLNLMTGPPAPRELLMSAALDAGKLCRRAVWSGSSGPVEELLEMLRGSHPCRLAR